ncbi:unnamed protein product [Clavelina lepadiformis]|uniref:Death domain-containing protein n=1 Tax=Clavelina lepadiformis TaxID=159417 RepID=A0ABP0FJG4_CLALP
MALNQESQLALVDDDNSLLTKLPDNFEERMDQRLNETDMRLVARAFEFCHIMEWKQFAEDFLQLPLADTENIQQDNRTRSDKIRAIFRKWLENSAEKGTIKNMISLLKKAKLTGIMERWFQQYKSMLKLFSLHLLL